MSLIHRLFASRKRPYVPGINNPEKVEVDISGSKLRLLLPPHCPYENFKTDIEPKPFVNFYDPTQYPKYFEGHPFAGLVFIQRTWNFYGPVWRGRYLGYTDFSAVITKVNCLPEGMSCLNPAHLEQVIIRMLYLGGPEKPELTEKVAPVNWLVTNHQNAQWVRWEVRKNLDDLIEAERFMTAQYTSAAITPLDDRHILRLSFNNNGYSPPEAAIKHMNNLRDRVLNHLELELAPSIKAGIIAAKTRWPKAKISQHREPEPWVYPEEWRYGKVEEGEPYVVIIKPGSKPPPFTP